MKRGKPLKRTELKRGKPLARGKPLERGTVPLKRDTPLMSVGKRARQRAPARREFVARILEERPHCQACPVLGRLRPRDAVDVHELVRRSQGGSILDEDNVLAVCRWCHGWIGDHPAEAESRGLAMWSWDTDYVAAANRRTRSIWQGGLPGGP